MFAFAQDAPQVEVVVEPPPGIPENRVELHGYARMPLNIESTPREPNLIDAGYFGSGFAYTRLFEGDWTELFLSVHHKDYFAKFGLFASFYSDYKPLAQQSGFALAQASIGAGRFLGLNPLSVEVGIFGDRFGMLDTYDTYIIGRTHQGGVKLRWDFAKDLYLQVSGGVQIANLDQSFGSTPVAYVTGGAPVGPVKLAGYLMRTWTNGEREQSNKGELWVAGTELRYSLPRDLGPLYAAAAYYRAARVANLGPALELLHSGNGAMLMTNYLGTGEQSFGSGDMVAGALEQHFTVTNRIGIKLFGLGVHVRPETRGEMATDNRTYLKWGTEPGYLVRQGMLASVRFDEVRLDVSEPKNRFHAISPRVRFLLGDWGNIVVQYTRYFYGDNLQPGPGFEPMTMAFDKNAFKIQAAAAW
jgi:hypothetical protein